MKVMNGKVVPDYDADTMKKLFGAAITFMERAQLNGQEAATFMASAGLLAALVDGVLVAAPATEQIAPAPAKPATPKAARK